MFKDKWKEKYDETLHINSRFLKSCKYCQFLPELLVTLERGDERGNVDNSIAESATPKHPHKYKNTTPKIQEVQELHLRNIRTSV